MKILFVSHAADRTGAPIALLQELLFIKEHCPDISVEILMLNKGEILSEFAKVYPVIIGQNAFSIFTNKLISRLRLKYKFRLYKYLFHGRKYDCIYANTVASLEVGCVLKKKFGVPLILHVHEAACLIHYYKISSDLFNYVDRYIAVSKLTADDIIRNYGVEKLKIKIQPPISYWLDKYKKNDILIKPFEYDSDVVLIGCFINNDWFKGVDLLPALIKRMYHKYPDANCKFALVGNLSEEKKWLLMHEIKKIGKDDKIVWLNRTEFPLNYHARFDILLLLSREESFSLVAQEAAIMNTPIIGFENSIGIEEWIGTKGGRWIPYLDIETMIDTIYELCSNKALRDSLGSEASTIVSNMYEEGIKMGNIISTIKDSL